MERGEGGRKDKGTCPEKGGKRLGPEMGRQSRLIHDDGSGSSLQLPSWPRKVVFARSGRCTETLAWGMGCPYPSASHVGIVLPTYDRMSVSLNSSITRLSTIDLTQ